MIEVMLRHHFDGTDLAVVFSAPPGLTGLQAVDASGTAKLSKRTIVLPLFLNVIMQRNPPVEL